MDTRAFRLSVKSFASFDRLAGVALVVMVAAFALLMLQFHRAPGEAGLAGTGQPSPTPSPAPSPQSSPSPIASVEPTAAASVETTYRPAAVAPTRARATVRPTVAATPVPRAQPTPTPILVVPSVTLSPSSSP